MVSPIISRVRLVSALLGSLRRVFGEFADLLWPPCCACCGVELKGESLGLCAPCRLGLMAQGPIDPPEACERAWSFWRYEDAASQLITRWKFGGDRYLEGILRYLLSLEELERAQAHLGLCSGVRLVPVPSHSSRLRSRGFDHTWALARALSALYLAQGNAVELWCGIRRCRKTHHQVGASRKVRRCNVLGAFELVNAEEGLNGHFVLVDDVVTTGSTARACAEVLRASGAESVGVLSLAWASS